MAEVEAPPHGAPDFDPPGHRPARERVRRGNVLRNVERRGTVKNLSFAHHDVVLREELERAEVFSSRHIVGVSTDAQLFTEKIGAQGFQAVAYTHRTLPTNREVSI